MKKNDLVSIIEFAIDNEMEAYEFYKNTSTKVTDKFLRETFENLAKEELEHKSFLEDFIASDASSMELEEVADYKIAETIDRPKLSTDMGFRDAIALAIKNEEEAMEMYKDLAEISPIDRHKEMFLNLMNMEKNHKAELEEIYVNVAYAEVW